jgi:ABC-2 type transport system permease protein
VLALSSSAAGILVVGRQPLIDLSGILLTPGQAAIRVVLAWLTVLLPVFGFTALAVLTSIVTRSSAAGTGLPVVAAMAMQLVAFLDSAPIARQMLMTSGFEAWRGLLTEPTYFGPLLYTTSASLLYVGACLAIAYRVLLRRDAGR